MAHLAWKECREIGVLRAYRGHLAQSSLREPTQRGYASIASSWVYTMALASGISDIAHEDEATCLDLARAGYFGEISLRRDSLVTARLLTLTHTETCIRIADWTRRKNISATVTGINGIDRFHRWLEQESLVEANHVHDIRERLEFTVSRFMKSLLGCKRV